MALCFASSPIQYGPTPETLKTLPAATEWPDFDNCHALLYGLRLVRDLSCYVERVEAWAASPAASQPAIASLAFSN